MVNAGIVVAFAAGFGVALVVEEFLRAFFRRASYRVARTYLGRIVLRRGLVRRRKIESIGSKWTMTIGSVSTPWVVRHRGQGSSSFTAPKSMVASGAVGEPADGVWSQTVQLRSRTWLRPWPVASWEVR
jgi:hypothetical protein